MPARQGWQARRNWWEAHQHSLTHSPAGCQNKSQAIWQRWVIERINNSFLKNSSKSITGLFKGIGEGKGAGIERECVLWTRGNREKGVWQDAKLTHMRKKRNNSSYASVSEVTWLAPPRVSNHIIAALLPDYMVRGSLFTAFCSC